MAPLVIGYPLHRRRSRRRLALPLERQQSTSAGLPQGQVRRYRRHPNVQSSERRAPSALVLSGRRPTALQGGHTRGPRPYRRRRTPTA